MNAVVDKASSVPYYLQLKSILLGQIEREEYSDGRLPSEKEIAERHQLTVTTVRKVLDDLQHLGRIYKIKGVGSFVRRPKLELDIANYLSFGRIMREKGLSERIEVISHEVVDLDTQMLNGYEVRNPSRKAVHIERIRSVENEPLAIEKLYFNNDECGPIADRSSDELIYDFIVNELKISVARIEEYLEPVNLVAQEARLLRVKAHSAALLITKVAHDSRGVWIEYSTTLIRGDKCRYHVRLR